MLTLVTGSDEEYGVTLRKRDLTGAMTTFTIDPAAVVTAAVITKQHKDQLIADVVQDELADQADWGNSLVVVAFPAVDTAAVTRDGKAILEISVEEDGKKKTWFGDIEIKYGTIGQ
jgi:hypothetical protein